MTEQLQIILRSNETTQEEKEVAFLEIQRIALKQKNFELLKDNIIGIKNVWSNITTARITKIIKKVFDMITCDYYTLENMLIVLDDLIAWAEENNKNLLRLDLECKRIYVYIFLSKYHEALVKIQEVVKDLKKFDDKNNLIGLYVYESKAFYKIKNFGRAKASLTAARALAVSTYCSYELQAQIDLFNGMYLCDERNYLTACSYFLESIEGFTIDKKYDFAFIAVRYLLLCRILNENQNEVNAIFKHKNFTRHAKDNVVQFLLEINQCCINRDLRKYLDLLNNNKVYLDNDEFLCSHVGHMYETLLENNILKITEAYSAVYLNRIAEELNFEIDVIEDKLRKMILDNKINGTINQNDMSLIINEDKIDLTVEKEIVKNIEKLKQICSINKN